VISPKFSRPVDKVLNNFFIDWGKLEKLSRAEFLSKIGDGFIQSLPLCLSRAQSIDFSPVNQVIHSKPLTLTITTNLINSLDIKSRCASFRGAPPLPAGQDPRTLVWQIRESHTAGKGRDIALCQARAVRASPRRASKINAGGRSPQADRAACGQMGCLGSFFIHKPGEKSQWPPFAEIGGG